MRTWDVECINNHESLKESPWFIFERAGVKFLSHRRGSDFSVSAEKKGTDPWVFGDWYFRYWESAANEDNKPVAITESEFNMILFSAVDDKELGV